MNKAGKLLLCFVALYLALSWTAVLAVDFMNLFSLQDRMLSVQPLPLLWYELYSEGRWTERMQWLCLGLAMAASFWLYLHARTEPESPWAAVALPFSIGLLFMLVEDSLNLRHIVADVYLAPLFDDDLPRRVRMIWELIFYASLSALMATGLWKLWRGFDMPKFLAGQFLLAYAIYGLVGFGSAARRVGDWQERLGDALIAQLDLARLPAWELALQRMDHWRAASSDYTFTLGYLLTDHLLEETVELIAAVLLATAVITACSLLRRKELPEREKPEKPGQA